MSFYVDQLGREILIPHIPKRIVSLVPSQTELLYDLGLEAEVVGITKFCIHPENWFRNKQRIGGTKTVHLEKLTALQPDLIIANKEENTREQVMALEAIAPVWVSDIDTVDEALEMIREIGNITGKAAKAHALIQQIQAGFETLAVTSSAQKTTRTAYLVWKNPYMAAGGDTFIQDIMMRAGLENVFAATNRYPEVTVEILREMQTELLLLSSEPYPFQQKHMDELYSQLPGVQIHLADGEMFSWYGSRMQYVPGYLQKLLSELSL